MAEARPRGKGVLRQNAVLPCSGVRIVCPLCKRVLENAPDDFAPRPFCSARCKLADLDNWLSGAYRVSTRLDGTEGTDPAEIEALAEAPADRR